MNKETDYYAAIYCRLSKDDEQIGESISIETQKMMLTDYCMKHGYQIFDIYIDDGFSGLNFNRPAFMKMIDDINEGKVNLVVTKDLSRLGRDYIQTGYFTEVFFNKMHVRYIAVNDNIDTNCNNNDIAPFKNILNDMYAKDLSRKVKLAKQQRALKGYFISGQAPFGYKPDPNDHNRLIIDEEAANIVRTIFRLAAEGNSYLAISRQLTESGIITPAAYKIKNGDTRFIRHLNNENGFTKWAYQTVRAILLDSVYKGDMVNHKTERINYKTKETIVIPKEEYIIVPNQHEAIIDSEEFEKVQQILLSRKYKERKRFENVFKGLVFCSECGKPMTLIARKNRSGKSVPLFKCFNHYKNPEECQKYHAVLYDDLYNAVQERIRFIFMGIKNSTVFECLKSKLVEQEKKKLAEKEKYEILKELSSVKKSIANISKTFVTDANSNMTMLMNLTKQQQKLTETLTDIERGKRIYEIDIPQIEEKLNTYLDIKSLDANLVSNLIEKIEIGESENCEMGKKRDIFITYTFDKEM